MWQVEENTLRKFITITQERDTLKTLQMESVQDAVKEKQTEVTNSVGYAGQSRKNKGEERGKRTVSGRREKNG